MIALPRTSLPLSCALLLAGLGAACDPPPPANQESAVPVRTERLEAAPFHPALTLLGVVGPANRADIAAPIAGTLRLAPRFRAGLTGGAEVAAGELLAVVEAPDPEQRLREARIAQRGAEQELARMRRGAELGVLPRADLERARVGDELARERVSTAERDFGLRQVRSPLRGRLVVQAAPAPGSQVALQTHLATVVGGGPLRVEGRAAPSDLAKLRAGLAVRFLLAADTGREGGAAREVGRGILREISPVTDLTGTAGAVAEVREDRGMPVPGEGVEIEVALEPRPAALTVPEEAIVATAQGSSVYRIEPAGEQLRARLVPVRTGERSGGRIEILEGLAAGDRIAVDGVSALRDKVAVSEEATAAAAPDPGGKP
jgi:membrane fusion protein (multidrug efflux system)